MDNKRVDSPLANLNDMATTPPHEVASPPPKMVDHCQPQPQPQPYMYPPMAMQMPQMQIAPAAAPSPSPQPDSKVYYQITSDIADTLEIICIHCNARIHPRVERHPTEKT